MTLTQYLIPPSPPRSFGKFGKLAPKTHPNTLKLSKYTGPMTPISPTPVHKVWREWAIKPGAWQMFGNDLCGDCVFAAMAHMLMLETEHTIGTVTPTLDEIIKAYSAVSGYDPATGANDNGAYISDGLDYWKNVGFAGHKIMGWAQVDHTNIWHVKQAVWIFGGLDIGVQMPQSGMDQFSRGQFWEVVPNDGGIVGGHSVPLGGYGSQGTNCVTWGQRQGMTWEWFSRYCDEAFVPITEDFINQATHLTPSGFDLKALETDLLSIKIKS